MGSCLSCVTNWSSLPSKAAGLRKQGELIFIEWVREKPDVCSWSWSVWLLPPAADASLFLDWTSDLLPTKWSSETLLLPTTLENMSSSHCSFMKVAYLMTLVLESSNYSCHLPSGSWTSWELVIGVQKGSAAPALFQFQGNMARIDISSKKTEIANKHMKNPASLVIRKWKSKPHEIPLHTLWAF